MLRTQDHADRIMSGRLGWRCMMALLAIMVGLFAIVPVPAAAYLRPGRTERVSVASDGSEGAQEIGSHLTSEPSRNGRYIAFSTLHRLSARDINLSSDVYLRDRPRHTTELVSVSSSEIPAAGGSSSDPSISYNGRHVAFASEAPNLVPGDTNQATDVFVRDLKSGKTERVSVASDGSESRSPVSGAASLAPFLSANGRYVAFASIASDLVANDTNNFVDVFVHDRRSKITERVSVSSSGTEGSRVNRTTCLTPSISPDGRYVAFTSTSPDLVGDDTNDAADVFLHDRSLRETERISLSSNGDQGMAVVGNLADSSLCGERSVSAGGRYVAFESLAANLVPDDRPVFGLPSRDIFVRDRQTGRTERVSVPSNGTHPEGVSTRPSISVDGRHVAFESTSNNLVDNDTGTIGLFPSSIGGGDVDVFVHDRATGATEMLSITTQGEEADTCVAPNVSSAFAASIDASGRYVSYSSCSANLAQDDQNAVSDLFVRDRGAKLGVGKLLSADGRATLMSRSARARIATLSDPHDDALSSLDGAEILGATLAWRPSQGDLYVRIDVDRLPGSHAGILSRGGPHLVHGLRFRVGNVRYELRASLSEISRFGLFRCDRLCNEVADLEGGYGTMGESLVTSIPLGYLGIDDRGDIKIIEAFAGLGFYGIGALRVLDVASP